MDKLYRNISKWIAQDNDTQEDIEVYAYAIECLLNQLIVFGVILAISAVFGYALQCFTMILFWMVLRNFLGGAHAPVRALCFMITPALFFFGMLLSYYSFTNSFWIIIPAGLAYGVITTLLIAPIDGLDDVDEKTRKKYRQISIAIAFIEAALVCLFYFIPQTTELAYYASVAMILCPTLAIIGYIQNRKLIKN